MEVPISGMKVTTLYPVLCIVTSCKQFYIATHRVGMFSLLFMPPDKGGGMEINMKKTVVFPINYSNREIIQYSSLIKEYTILFGIVLDVFAEDTFPEDNIIEYSEFKTRNIDYDTIIFLRSAETINANLYIALIKQAIEQKKEIVVFPSIYEQFKDIFINYKTTIINNECEIENEMKNKVEKQEVKLLKNIRTPIISVMGMGEYCNKFSCELELRNFFVSRDYKVLQIGSKDFSCLFGIEKYPDFLNQKEYSLEDKAFMFNKLISIYEKKYNPDIIIIGIPGGILPVNNKILNGLGEIPFIISNSLKIDVGIMCVYNNAVESYIINEYINCCKYRFNTRVENILVSNTAFTFNMDRDMRSLKYYHLKRSFPIDFKNCGSKKMFSICNIESMINGIHSELLNGVDVI